MPPSDDDLFVHLDDTLSPSESSPSESAERHELVGGRRSWAANLTAIACVVGLAVVVVTGGSDSETDRATPTTPTTPTTSSTPTTPTTSTAASSGPFADPTVEGQLIDGRAFAVFEPSPGVLCAVIDGIETCHLELVTASGPGVVDGALVFGYLAPGTTSATIRYRSIRPSGEGTRVEADARFFAIPLQDDDPYRLQYRDADFEVDREVPLVLPRGGPSQSPEEAERDGVPAEVAALSFDRRVMVEAEWSAFAEGPMVWSIIRDTLDSPLVEQRRWGELLLLDPTGTRIERSTPLPAVRLFTQLAQPDTLYFLGQQNAVTERTIVDRAELTLPIVVVRIDRASGAALVRVFPRASVNTEPDIEPVIDQEGWQLGPLLPDIDGTALGVVDDVIQLETTDGGTVRLDAVSLLPID